MGESNQWLKGGRLDQLNMAMDWLAYCGGEMVNEKGEKVPRYRHWGMTDDYFAGFGDTVGEAQGALTEAQNEETRTKLVDKRVKLAFKALVAAMREMKNRFFHIPPLTEVDFAALKLRVPDKVRTPGEAPTGQYAVDTFLVGRHQLGLRFVLISGAAKDSGTAYRVYYKVVGPGEKPPASPEEFSKSFPEKRKTCVVDFDFGDSGKTVYFCVQLERGKKKGPWGPMSSALIP